MKKALTVISFLVALLFFSCNHGSRDEKHLEAHAGDIHEGEHPEGNAHTLEVQLTAEHIKQMGIVVKPLTGGTVNSEIQRPATVLFVPDQTVQVGPRISAKVEKVSVDLGEKVSKGQTLARLSSVELGKIKAKYLSLASRFQTEKEAYRREQKLYEEKISSESDYLLAKAQYDNTEAELASVKETLQLFGIHAEKIREDGYPLSYFTLQSPISGMVQKRDLSPGQTLSPQSTPIQIVNNREMWVMIDAYESDISTIREGQPVNLTLKSLPGKRFEGEVDWISDALDPGTRTLKVRALVENRQGLLKDGMYGTASVMNESESPVPIVPVDAVQTMDNRKFVFIPADEARSFEPAEVSTGKENNGWIEIAGNIRIGQPVVVQGAFELMSALTSGSRSAAHHH